MGDRRKETPPSPKEGEGRVTRKKEIRRDKRRRGRRSPEARGAAPGREGGVRGQRVAAPAAQWPARPLPRAPRAPLTSWCRRRRGFPSSRETREASSPGGSVLQGRERSWETGDKWPADPTGGQGATPSPRTKPRRRPGV